MQGDIIFEFDILLDNLIYVNGECEYYSLIKSMIDGDRELR